MSVSPATLTTYRWVGSAGGWNNPLVVWHYAETEESARRQILRKFQALKEALKKDHRAAFEFTQGVDTFGVVFIGCCTQLPSVEEMRDEILAKKPTQLVRADLASGIATCLSG